MTVLHVDAVIANAASQSGELDITDKVLMAIEVPSAWTAAVVTLLAAQKSTAEGGTYVAVKDQAGAEVTFTVAASQIHVIIEANLTRALQPCPTGA